MSVASTWPAGPTRRAARSDCSPAPAATSSTRLPGADARPARASVSVAAPSQLPRSAPAVPRLGRGLPLRAGGRLEGDRVEAVRRWSCVRHGLSVPVEPTVLDGSSRRRTGRRLVQILDLPRAGARHYSSAA